MSKYDFERLKLSAGGVDVVPTTEMNVKYRSSNYKEQTVGDWFKHAEDEAQTIGLRTDEHPEGTLAWGCRLWIGDREMIAADPRTIVYYIQGIKLAMEMMMRGEMTVEKRNDEDEA